MAQQEHSTVRRLDRPEWLPAQEWPFQPQTIEIGGRRIHYVDIGEGPTLLLVHAGMWAFVWRDVITALQDRFRCVTLDFPGSGLSQAVDRNEPTITGHSRVLERFVDELGLREITFVLHDLGGPIGLAVAARRPQLVRALVVSQAFGWPPRQRALRGMLALMGSRSIETLNVATNLVPRLTSTSFGVGRTLTRDGKRAFLGPLRDRAKRHPFHRLMADVRHCDEMLTSIEQALATTLAARPLLTIFGERNDPLGFQKRWKSLYPAARESVVAKAHHFPMNDDAEQFACTLLEWWQEEVAAPGLRVPSTGRPCRGDDRVGDRIGNGSGAITSGNHEV